MVEEEGGGYCWTLITDVIVRVLLLLLLSEGFYVQCQEPGLEIARVERLRTKQIHETLCQCNSAKAQNQPPSKSAIRTKETLYQLLVL